MTGTARIPKSGLLLPEQAAFIKYEGEDHEVYILSDRNGAILRVPKNRNGTPAPRAAGADPFSQAYILLFLAFLGLAPAGLGTLIFAPLAMLWTLGIAVFRRLGRTGLIRIAAVWGMAALMLLAAAPLAAEFLRRAG
jgi:hypothetical protein